MAEGFPVEGEGFKLHEYLGEGIIVDKTFIYLGDGIYAEQPTIPEGDKPEGGNNSGDEISEDEEQLKHAGSIY